MTTTKTASPLITALFLLCGSLGTAARAEDEDCFPSPEYQGINAVPAATMQIFPSAGGDTVNNDALYPQGNGPHVVIGYWEHIGEPDENPCVGEPTMKIAYPVDYGSKECFGWNHWVVEQPDCEGCEPEIDLHENSAKNFSCETGGAFVLDQWVDTMKCEPEGKPRKTKIAYRDQCCLDTKGKGSAIYGQILSGCGKVPPLACSEDTPVDPAKPHFVRLGFWRSSKFPGPEVPDEDPIQTIDFTWSDPEECFVWIRDVDPEAGGGKRMNVGTSFSFEFRGDEVSFTYVQNSGACCGEFQVLGWEGTSKTFHTDKLEPDQSTGQTGDMLMVAVVAYRTTSR